MKDRFQCEVRYCLQLRTISRERLADYLYRNEICVAKKRGKAEADRLRDATQEQWELGNRGNWDDWRTS